MLEKFFIVVAALFIVGTLLLAIKSLYPKKY